MFFPVKCSLNRGWSWRVYDSEWKSRLGFVDKIASFINERPFQERLGHLHIFPIVPNALLSFIGQIVRSFGRCTLYEYDCSSGQPGKYEPAITLPPQIEGDKKWGNYHPILMIFLLKFV